MPHSTESLPETSHQANPRIQRGPTLAHVTEQPGLPIKFDSKRGCDQIRARLYHDPRLVGLELTVALALSEFVRLPACVAYPKQKLLVRMVHATRARVSNALQRLETKGVLTIDRGRSHCRYVFLETWRGRFQTVPRCAGKAHLDVLGKHIPVEPIDQNLVLRDKGEDAAAVVPAETTRPDQQQQRRIDGMIASCEISARAIDRDFDAAEHRERIRTGDLSIEEMQEFTDGLRIERDERGRRVRL